MKITKGRLEELTGLEFGYVEWPVDDDLDVIHINDVGDELCFFYNTESHTGERGPLYFMVFGSDRDGGPEGNVRSEEHIVEIARLFKAKASYEEYSEVADLIE